MNERELIQPLLQKLSKDFGLEANSLPVKKDFSEELKMIKEFLTKKIAELMEKDYEKFLNTLYRIDINENKAAEIIKSTSGNKTAEELADLVIIRQLQRVKTQVLYKQGKL